MDLVDGLGFVAGVVAAGSLFPQVLQSWRTRSTKDISLTAFSVLTFGNFLWLVYGVLIGSIPVMVTNVVTGSMLSSIVVLKLKYK